MYYPAKNNENLESILANICQCLNAPLRSEDYNTIYRTSGPSKKTLIVQFNSEAAKAGLLNAKKAKRTLLLEEIDPNLAPSNNEIFINHHLTPYFTELLYFARQGVKRKEIFSCWFTSRGITIKESEESQPVLVYDKTGLSRYVTITENPTEKRRASSELQSAPKKIAGTTNNKAKPTPNNNQQDNKRQPRNSNKPTLTNRSARNNSNSK